jgi:hypothetical protein
MYSSNIITFAQEEAKIFEEKIKTNQNFSCYNNHDDDDEWDDDCWDDWDDWDDTEPR